MPGENTIYKKVKPNLLSMTRWGRHTVWAIRVKIIVLSTQSEISTFKPCIWMLLMIRRNEGECKCVWERRKERQTDRQTERKSVILSSCSQSRNNHTGSASLPTRIPEYYIFHVSHPTAFDVFLFAVNSTVSRPSWKRKATQMGRAAKTSRCVVLLLILMIKYKRRILFCPKWTGDGE